MSGSAGAVFTSLDIINGGPPLLPYGFSVSSANTTVSENSSGTSYFTFTVTRFGDLSTAASITWVIYGGGSVSNPTYIADAADFGGTAFPAGTLTFAPGQVSQTVTIPITADPSAGTDEYFTVALGSTAGMTSAPLPPDWTDRITATILSANPSVSATYSLNWNQYTGFIGPQSFYDQNNSSTFTITRSGDVSAAGSVDWSIVGVGTNPASGADFVGGVLPSGTAVFAPGQTSVSIPIPLVYDGAPAPNEGFQIQLSNPSSGTGIDVGSLDATILANIVYVPPTFAITADMASVQDGPPGSVTNYTFTITRTGDTSTAMTINWNVSATAVPGVSGLVSPSDFVGGSYPSGTVTFAPGVTSQVITIPILGDGPFEANEGFVVSIYSDYYNAVISLRSANGVILNDNMPPDYNGTAGNDTVSFATATSGKILNLSQGGNDTATGSPFNDTFYLGAALNSTDKINGGGGTDTLVLNGDYSAGLILGPTTVTNISKIVLLAGNNYNLTTNDATVANGASLTIDASALASVNSATINGAAERSASLIFIGGAGNDVFTGGRGADSFTGGLGADILTGGPGADTFHYNTAADSPLLMTAGTINVSADDLLPGFQPGTDAIDLTAFGFTGAAASVLTRSTTGFSSTLAAGAGFFGGAGVVVEYVKAGKTYNARVYVDANHDGSLDSGDMLIQLTGVAKGSVGASSFHF